MDYGKIALTKIDRLYKTNNQKEKSYINKCVQYSVKTSQKYFVIDVNGQGFIYFNMSTSSKVNCRVYINSQIQYYKYNFDFASIRLNINGNESVKFEFDTDVAFDCNLTIMGNFNLKDEDVTLVSIPSNFRSIFKYDGMFLVSKGDSVSDSIAKFYSATGGIYGGEFFDLFGSNILYKLSDGIYIYNGSKNIKTNLPIVSFAQIVELNNSSSKYLIAYIIDGFLNIVYLDSLGQIINGFYNISAGNNLKVYKICRVSNIVDDRIYFVCTDKNSNNFILLCNIENNGLNTTFSNPIYLCKSEECRVLKTTSNNYLISYKNAEGFKVLDANIYFENGQVNLVDSRQYNNANDVCLIDAERIVVRYDDSIIEVDLS